MKQHPPIVIKKLSLFELIIFEGYLQRIEYEVPIRRETELQVEKRFKEQARWREILKKVKRELRERTKEIQ